jgi:hypothetical protein
MCSVQLQQQQQQQQLLDFVIFEAVVNCDLLYVFLLFFVFFVGEGLCIFTFINYSKYEQNVMCMGNVTVRVPEELKGG